MCHALSDTRWASSGVDELAGFSPDSSMRTLGRRRVLHPFTPGLADGGTIGDELATWLGFEKRIEKPHMLCSVGALLHVFVSNPPKRFDLLAVVIRLYRRPCRAWVRRVTSHARSVVVDWPILWAEFGSPEFCAPLPW